MKNRTIALFLLSCFLLLNSCGSSAQVQTPTGETTAGADVPAETTSMWEADSLPALDFNGEEVTIFVQDYGGYSAVDFFNDGQTGDVVNDAIWQRNEAVSERLNVTLNWTSHTHSWNDRNDYLTMLRSSIQAGDAAWDFITGLGYFIPGFVGDGILMDMSELPYIDIDKPWWSKKFMEASSVDDRYYFVTGDACLGLIKNMFCIFENLELAKTLNLAENPYELVYNGKWTLDKLTELSRSQYADLNGNTEVDSEDRFGLLVNSGNHVTGFIEALGVDIVDFSGNDPKFVFGSEHAVDVIQKLTEVIKNTEGIYYDTKGEQETVYNSIFRNQNILFATGWLMHADSYRDLSFDYGVLPYPKWDESQKNYDTTVLTSYSVLSIPSDCKNPKRAAAIIEALGSESYRTVTPAYFETALKVKYARDNDTSKMFDIIRDGINFDFGYIYTIAMSGVSDQFKNAVGQNDPNWASRIAGIETAMTDSLKNLTDAIRKIES